MNMKTYCIAVAAAITLIFAIPSYASPKHEGEHRRDGYSQQHKRGHNEGRDRASHHRKEMHDKRNHKRDYAHGDRRHHVDKRHVKKHHIVKHHRHVERHVKPSYPHSHHKHHRNHKDVHWSVNLDLSPWVYAYEDVYDDRVVYQRRSAGRCYRLERGYRQEVWIEVPNYKCDYY